MQRDINVADIRAESTEHVSKLGYEELSVILAAAKEKLPRLVARYAKEMGVSYEKVFVKTQKTRWGSCSSKGNINLNCLLMSIPAYVRKYVIVHELAHRKEMNHSERFWKVVADEMPEYKKAVKWLKKNGDSLIGRLP
jgi:Predicted metal-dependent hydrolase